MKRFIDIGEQTGNTDEGVKEFCFFDTVTDKFETFQEECCWTSVGDFTESYNGNEIDRYLSLITEEFK